MKKVFVFFGALLCSCALFAENFKPKNLTVGEFFENPIGYSLDDLSISWQLPLIRNGISQTAYRVIASRSATDFSTLVWDSGKVMSSQSVSTLWRCSYFESRTHLLESSCLGWKWRWVGLVWCKLFWSWTFVARWLASKVDFNNRKTTQPLFL